MQRIFETQVKQKHGRALVCHCPMCVLILYGGNSHSCYIYSLCVVGGTFSPPFHHLWGSPIKVAILDINQGPPPPGYFYFYLSAREGLCVGTYIFLSLSYLCSTVAPTLQWKARAPTLILPCDNFYKSTFFYIPSCAWAQIGPKHTAPPRDL